MSESNVNFKITKPTLKPPSEMGKKIDSQFKSKSTYLISSTN